jgi:AcrR family transcriptional regulator
MVASDAEERLLTATHQALAERGFDADITDILSRAGVGAGTLYRHFENKEALFRVVIEKMAAKVAQQLLEVASSYADAREAIARTMAVGFNTVKEYGRLPIAMFAGTEPPEYSDCIDHVTLRALFGALIRRGIEQGHFRPDVDVEYAVAVWFALAAPQALNQLLDTRSVEEIAASTTEFFLAGISRQPGRP